MDLTSAYNLFLILPDDFSQVTISSLLRKARNFLRLPRFERLWFVPAWVLLGVSRFAILAFSFRRLAPRLGAHGRACVWVPVLDKREEELALHIGRIVRMAARYTPWESNCFPQAVTARLLLGLYGVPYALFFGLARDGSVSEMKAHAWVAAGRVRVAGGNSFEQFAVVGCFVSPRLASVFADCA